MTQRKFEVPSSVGLTAFAACAARAIEGSRLIDSSTILSQQLTDLGWAVEFQSLEDCAVSLGTPLSDEFSAPPSDKGGAEAQGGFSPADMSRCGYVTGELAARGGDAG